MKHVAEPPSGNRGVSMVKEHLGQKGGEACHVASPAQGGKACHRVAFVKWGVEHVRGGSACHRAIRARGGEHLLAQGDVMGCWEVQRVTGARSPSGKKGCFACHRDHLSTGDQTYYRAPICKKGGKACHSALGQRVVKHVTRRGACHRVSRSSYGNRGKSVSGFLWQ